MSQPPSEQYSRQGILRYAQIFGDGFLSPGGLDMTVDLCRAITFRPGLAVLDVGSGLGGAAFHMAKRYGARVTGLDLSAESVKIARERLADLDLSDVTFQQGSVLAVAFKANTFDLIWSRETFLHIADKPTLFRNLYHWLAPGGQLLFTDYVRRDEATGPLSEKFAAYIQQSGYTLLDAPTYVAQLKTAGFTAVVAEARTDQFLTLLKREKNRLLTRQKATSQSDGVALSEEDMYYLIERWNTKIDFCQTGDMKWSLLRAEKRAL